MASGIHRMNGGLGIAKRMKEGTKPNDKVIIVYGNGKFPPSMKGQGMAAPVGSLSRSLSKSFPVVMIDEFKTSQICPTCKEKLDHKEILTTRKRKVDNLKDQKISKAQKLRYMEKNQKKWSSTNADSSNKEVDEEIEPQERTNILKQFRKQRTKTMKDLYHFSSKVVKSHHLLECKKHCYSISGNLKQHRRKDNPNRRSQIQNRDHVAVMNMEEIFRSLMSSGERPKYFQRTTRSASSDPLQLKRSKLTKRKTTRKKPTKHFPPTKRLKKKSTVVKNS